MTAADIAKAALGIEWRNTESAARRVAEHAANALAAQAAEIERLTKERDERNALAIRRVGEKVAAEARAALPAAPEGWTFSVHESDGRTWLRIRNPAGAEAALSTATAGGGGKSICAQVLDHLKDALSASPPPPEQGEGIGLAEPPASPALGRAGPMVRDLEWVGGDGISRDRECYHADDGFGGHYLVIERQWWHSDQSVLGFADTDDLAKAAAQADYERRILSALQPTQPAPAPVAAQPQQSAEPGGWLFRFIYRNHRGVVSERFVKPITLWFGKTGWHPEYQWFLKAFDLDKRSERDFALQDINPPPASDERVAAMRERCAWTATSFLVGDPANGVPLRSPGPHEIAKAIRALPLDGEG